MNSFHLFRLSKYLFFIFLFLIPVLSNAQAAWQVKLYISCDDWQTTLHFGVNPDGSDSYDTGLDTMSPPPGFGPCAYFYIESFPNYLLTDIRKPQESLMWQIKTANCTGKKLKLKWNMSEFNANTDGTARLEMVGLCDMTEVDSLLIDGDISSEIKLTISTAVKFNTGDLENTEESSLAAYPNPFNNRASFIITLPKNEFADIQVYDILGRLVKKIFHGNLTSGKHTMHWDGTDSNGQDVATGLYFCRAILGNKVFIYKVQLLR